MYTKFSDTPIVWWNLCPLFFNIGSLVRDCFNQLSMVGIYYVTFEAGLWKAKQFVNFFRAILILGVLSHHVKSAYLKAAISWVSLSSVERPHTGAEPNNDSEWALRWFHLCRISPSLQIFPAEAWTWRIRVKLFILCPEFLMAESVSLIKWLF